MLFCFLGSIRVTHYHMPNADVLISSENHGKKTLHPLDLTAPIKQQQNTDFPESKALFVVYEVKKRL